MIYVFNKNKILSYMVASFIVLLLFVFGASFVPSPEVDLVQVSANTTNNQILNNIQNIKE